MAFPCRSSSTAAVLLHLIASLLNSDLGHATFISFLAPTMSFAPIARDNNLLESFYSQHQAEYAGQAVRGLRREDGDHCREHATMDI